MISFNGIKIPVNLQMIYICALKQEIINNEIDKSACNYQGFVYDPADRNNLLLTLPSRLFYIP